MRLINSDKLYEDLANNLSSIMGDGSDGEAIDTYVTIGDIIHDTFNAQPTAYDPDKVVERLEELKKAEQDRSDDCDEDGNGDAEQIYDDGRSQGRFEAFGKAIEIVKGKYVTEQSCEWKLEDSESNLYVTGCENRQLIFEGTPEENGYKYCTYCGRKITRGGTDGN